MTSPVAIIGGYGPGLGRGLADVFASAGYAVATISRRGAGHPNAKNHACDLTDEAQARNVIGEICKSVGRVDVYIHNVAALHIGPFLDTPPEKFEEIWRSSFLSAVHATQTVLPHMLKRGTGTLLVSGATAAIKGGKNFSAFASTKFALRGLAQALAREFQPQGIHVAHIILDGLVNGTASVARFGGTEETSIDPHQAAKAYLALVLQERSAWSQEIDIRPFCESF